MKINAIFDESSETFSNTHRYKKFMYNEDFMVQARRKGRTSFSIKKSEI